ncbi:MAG: hypothetical protein M1829_000504 [Trizodia sp. TS-e1964]|nr:MAG: hypothetical protein M1829_000504 [Trizodia sp. TS-e1964]
MVLSASARQMLKFQTARPPLPPQPSSNQSGVDENQIDESQSEISAFNSPNSSPGTASGSLSNPRKVSWSLDAVPAYCGLLDKSPLKLLPPSRELSSCKSILKQSKLPAITFQSGGLADALPPAKSSLDILESTVKQLASGERSDCLDAYASLMGAFKEYKNMLDPDVLRERLGLYMQFIQRDMARALASTNPPDQALLTYALKLAKHFLSTEHISKDLTNKFCTYIMDRSLDALENNKTSKTIIRHYIQILLQQQLSSQVLTKDKASRLIDALENIHQHVKGNGIQSERFVIYQRLLSHSRLLMGTKTTAWAHNLFNGMFSSTKEIRQRAISFGLDASLALGSSSFVSRCIVDLLNIDIGGQKMAQHLDILLRKMIRAKEGGTQAPQIWSIVVLFLRSHSREFEQWEHMEAWLKIIDSCSESSDPAIKNQVHIARSRVYFASGPANIKSPRQPTCSIISKKRPASSMQAEGDYPSEKKPENLDLSTTQPPKRRSMRINPSLQNNKMVALEVCELEVNKSIKSPHSTKKGSASKLKTSLTTRSLRKAKGNNEASNSIQKAIQNTSLSGSEIPLPSPESNSQQILEMEIDSVQAATQNLAETVIEAPILELQPNDDLAPTAPVAENPLPAPTGLGIISTLKRFLGDLQRAVLGRQELRELDDVLFEIRVGAHDAARRSLDEQMGGA